jgi:hypothetical protein
MRRVKCDETKPECIRCVKFGGVKFCDGYESQEKERKASISSMGPSKLLMAPSRESLKTEDEFQCLRFYTEETAPGLSGILDGGFWTQILLQTGQRQLFIQHAIITIGALSKILKIGGVRTEASFAPRMQMTEDEVALQKHYLFALQQYHKFIRGTRAHLLAQENDKRAVLMSCLLITCIERLQNHNQSALTQATSGLKIMQKWIEQHATSEVLDKGKLADRGWSIACVPGISSPEPQKIEDGIVDQFRRLEVNTLALNSINLSSERKYERAEEAALKIMPPTFTDIKDARLYFELILRRGFHFIREVQRASTNSKPVVMVTFSDEENPVLENPSNPPDISQMGLDDLVEEQQIHIAENKHWDDAFQHLFRRIHKSFSDSHPELLCATLLEIRSIALSIRLAAVTSASELVYDGHLPEFQKIISLARPMVENPKLFNEGSFCFEQGFILDVSLVASSCRDRKVRREAIELLNLKDWREGTWGSRRVADAVQFLMDTEEEGVETDFIPEYARARFVRIEVEVEKHQAFIECMKGVGTDAVLKSCVRDWSSFH